MCSVMERGQYLFIKLKMVFLFSSVVLVRTFSFSFSYSNLSEFFLVIDLVIVIFSLLF